MRSSASAKDYREVVLIGLCTLFFLQLLTTWIESMYRMGVIKTSMGNEMFGMLVIFAPLLLVVVPSRFERMVLQIAIVAVLAARIAIPLLGVRANIIVAGVGVAASVVVMTFAFTGSYAGLRRELGAGLSLGLLGSIALRAWGSSYDPTLGGPGVVIGWGLTALAALLLLGSPQPAEQHDPPGRGSAAALVLLPIALFANIAVLYWVLSSPAVVTAWSESSYLVNTVLLVVGWSAATWQIRRLQDMPSVAVLIWNILFTTLLVGGIYIHTPAVPMSVDASPVIVETPQLLQQIPLHLMCLLSPVVLVNILLIANQEISARPRALVAPMVLGLMTLVVLTFMAIFTNVWGYVGEYSAPFRGNFFLPFLVACILMMLPFFTISRKSTGDLTADGSQLRSGVAVLVVGLIAITGVVVKSWRGGPPALDQNRLTVLTYNLQLGSEPEGDQNYHDQIELLRKIDADIVGLQESDAARPGGGNVDVARMFGDALGYYTYYGPNTIAGTFGTAILSRFPLKNTRTIFSYSTKDEAGTAAAEIEVSGVSLTIFNSHPAGKDKAKLAHIDDLVHAVQQHKSVIAVGDYNMRQGSEMYRRISNVLVDSWNSINPDSIGQQHPTIGVGDGAVLDSIDMTGRIDHIFHSSNFSTAESYYLPSPQSETDHPAHWSMLTWK